MKDLIKYGLPWLILVIAPSIIANFFDFRIGAFGIGFLAAIAASYYLNLDNPHQYFKKHLIITLFVWVLSLPISEELKLGSIPPAIASAILAYVYFLRFRSRPEKHWVDYLKLIGVLSLVPATYLNDITPFICMYLAFIYLLDRLIIRRQMNKTTQIIIFCVMGLFCLSMLVYSFIKADEAEKSAIEARLAQEEAQNQVELCRQTAQEAEEQAAIVTQIMEELQACKASK